MLHTRVSHARARMEVGGRCALGRIVGSDRAHRTVTRWLIVRFRILAVNLPLLAYVIDLQLSGASVTPICYPDPPSFLCGGSS